MEDRREPELPRPEPQDEPSLPTPESPRDAEELQEPAEAAPPAAAESEEAALPARQAPTAETEEADAPEGAEGESQAAETTPEQEPEAATAEAEEAEAAGVLEAAEEVELPSEFGVDEPMREEEGAEAAGEESAEPGKEEPAATEPAAAEAAPATPTPKVEAAPAVAAPVGEPPAAPKKPPPWGWIIGIGCGCGCLAVLLAIAIPAFLGYLAMKEQSSVTSQEAPTPVEVEQSESYDGENGEGASVEGASVEGEESEPLPDDLSEFDISAPGRDGDGEGDPDGAGLRNAVIFAREHKPGWTVQVTSHEDGWTRVHMVAGPSKNALTTWMQLSWDEASGGYELVNEALLESDDGGRPGIYTPGEEVAKEAALVDYPDWVAKVDRHSSDWTTAVVWVGPPQSEWVSEIRLRWDREQDCYEVVGEAHIPYGDEEE